MSEDWCGIVEIEELLSDLDTNFSGVGGATSSSFDMSDALSVLPVLKTSRNSKEKSILANRGPIIATTQKHDEHASENKSHISWNISSQDSLTKKHNGKKSRPASICSSIGNSASSSPDHLLYSDENTLFRVSSAPSLSQSFCKLTFRSRFSTQEEVSSSSTKFQYILLAPTALGSRFGEHTLTYLNQGQSYEVRLMKLENIPDCKGKLLRSTIHVGFQERRLQFREKLEINSWQVEYRTDRILDIDLALSYGIFDVKFDPNESNICKFLWDSSREASVFIKINCISTEFTSRRKGGEKGVPFRVVIGTCYDSNNAVEQLHQAWCLVKVFKAKGADRKRKTDKEKIAKLPSSEQMDLQPSKEFTVFTELSSDFDYTLSQNLIFCESPKSVKSEDAATKTSEINFSAAYSPCSSDSQENLVSAKFVNEEEKKNNFDVLISMAAPNELSNWLMQHRFNKCLTQFASFTGNDVLCLNREDLTEICGAADGIRLYNTLRSRPIQPALSIYVSFTGQIYQTLYFHTLTLQEVEQQLCEFCKIELSILRNSFIIGPMGILVCLTDKSIQNMRNESIYLVEITKEDDNGHVCLILHPHKASESNLQ